LPLLWRAAPPVAPSIRLVALGEGGIVGVVPVDKGEVEADPEAFGAKRIHVLPYDIASKGGVFDRVRRVPRMEHREAVMMLAGQHRVGHPGPPRHPRPSARIEIDGIEGAGGAMVFLDGDVA